MITLLQSAQYLVLVISYFGLAIGYIPGLRMNRTTIAFVGSGLLIGLGLIDVKTAWEAIDPNTIIFLLSMMVVNANLSYGGFFQWALTALLRLTSSPFGLLMVLTWSSGILSAFFLNDTLAIVMTPLVLRLTQTLQLNPILYLLALAGATNVGSVAALSGNPQNILIGSFSKIPYLEFAKALTPVALMGLMSQIALVWVLYPEVRSFKSSSHAFSIPVRVFKPLFLKSILITTGMLLAFVIGVSLVNAAFVAAALLLMTRRVKPQRILKEVDWNLLVMFAGLFVLTRCTQELNFLSQFTSWTRTALRLTLVTTFLSNLISNIPAVLLLHPFIVPDNSQSWLLLAASSTLAGNLTLFGSVANIIVAEAAGQLGYRLSFEEHLRFGLPLMAGTGAIAYFWLT
jgi:Na+/H+ antiporter NhaD/arsenite permease-like protein